jgi:hypothetical protein
VNKIDLISGAGLSVAGLVLIFIIIPHGTEAGVSFGLSPTVFPTILATGMTACAMALTVQALLRLRAGSDPRPSPISGWNMLMFGAASALILAGIVAINYLGMVIAGPLLIACLMLFLGDRSIIRIVLTSTIPVAAIYFLAIYVLRTPVP